MESTNQEEKWTLVAAALSFAHPLGAACGMLGFLVLAGYFGHVEELYRPMPGEPGTHPLAAVSLILLGVGIFKADKSSRGVLIKRLVAAAALWIAASRILEVALGIDLTSYMTPFNETVILEKQLSKHNDLGFNSALMVLAISLALFFRSWGFQKLSQVSSFIAIAIPAISFIGYAYGLDDFHGQMSLLTAIIGFGIGLATLALSAEHWAVRAMLSPYIGGKIARIQVTAGFIIPIALGYLMVRSLVGGQKENYSLFGVFVVVICWFIIFMVSIAAVVNERSDFSRRSFERKLAEAAQTDSLTGLANRRMFFDFGHREVDRIRRTQGELWVLMVDVDKFKRVNDIGGHAVGDQVLQSVATTLAQSIRKMDLIGRLGGEEFAILLTDTDQSGCERVAEGIRSQVESLNVPGWSDIHGPVTVSVGCARLGPQDLLEPSLAKADKALYCAKNSGRNRVVFEVLEL